ncbi:MAG: hypothetical protein JRF31_11905 [Deltaproteobacteria bacterium]|nr:hypothetical protein [Deltaproteobacteria bacterium]
MPTATLKIFLVFGDPKRLRTAKLSNWNGIAEPDTNKSAIYIGEAECIKDRIKSHSIRNDGYINDTRRNIEQYEKIYTPLLTKESAALNQKDARFKDVNQFKQILEFAFRPCDVEMALWEEG